MRESPSTTTLGQRLKESRLAKDMTQLDVSRLTGINNKTVSNWEKDVSSPSVADLKILAMLYGVSADSLLGIKGFPAMLPSGFDASLADAFLLAPKATQELIRQVLCQNTGRLVRHE
jgi:transcriptional regulator with XRE-family HTH domain